MKTVKKCMEIRVEGRPVGRPRKTWLENVEYDMAELEITEKTSMTGRNGEGMLGKGNPTLSEHGL